MLAPILFISRVELDVTIAGSFVFEKPQTKVTTERHLVAVCLSNSPTMISIFLFFCYSISYFIETFLAWKRRRIAQLDSYLFVFLEKRQSRKGSLTKSTGERNGEGRVGGRSGVGIADTFATRRRWRCRNNHLAVGRRHFHRVSALYLPTNFKQDQLNVTMFLNLPKDNNSFTT